jgi:hypothetical protein
MKIDFTKKINELKQTRRNFRDSLRYKKLISLTAQQIIRKDTLRLNDSDYKEIAFKLRNRTDKLLISRIRQTLHQEIVKNDVSNELIRIYTEAGLSKDEIKPLLENVKSWIIEKKDITNGLKLIDKIEKVNNFDNNGVKATYKETTDFSKLGKDGQPAQKVTKTLEITKNEAIRDDMSNDLNKVNDSVSPEDNDLSKG